MTRVKLILVDFGGGILTAYRHKRRFLAFPSRKSSYYGMPSWMQYRVGATPREHYSYTFRVSSVSVEIDGQPSSKSCWQSGPKALRLVLDLITTAIPPSIVLRTCHLFCHLKWFHIFRGPFHWFGAGHQHNRLSPHAGPRRRDYS